MAMAMFASRLADTFKNMFVDNMENAFTSFDTSVKKAQDALNGFSSMSVAGEGIWTALGNLSSLLTAFCDVLLVIFFMMEIISVAQRVDTIKWESVIKLCVKYAFTVEIIRMSSVILFAIYSKASEWVTAFAGRTGTFSVGQQMVEQIRENHVLDGVDGLGDSLGLLMTSFIVVLAIKLCGLLIQIIAYGRMFEIAVYIVISPLPFAFFPRGTGGEGISRTTTKFLRNFAAVCLQGVMMLIVFYVFNILLSSELSSILGIGGGAAASTVVGQMPMTPEVVEEAAAATASATAQITEALYGMLLASVALVMGLFKCSGWAKSILDAN